MLQNLIGLGLRSSHINHVILHHKSVAKKVGWFEVHSENYYKKEAYPLQNLIAVRKHFPLSLHSVGNSLGSVQKIDLSHLQKLKNLIEAVEPFLVSDHLSWGAVDGNHLNDLLPLPYTKESLKVITDNVCVMQDFLQRQILVENPSSYLRFAAAEMSEMEFINELVKRSGCGLLLDVNNIYVSANNNAAFCAQDYIAQINKDIVCEIHLAGHSKSDIFVNDGKTQLLIDTHSDRICDEVLSIYKMAAQRFGKIPSLIEWDVDVPPFEVLLEEVEKLIKN